MNIFKKLLLIFKKRPKLIVILGQTATGKSSLSVELALKYNGEIISADSRQVYRGLNIGSAKITQEEMHGVPHHMLDLADPKEKYSVQEYTTEANKIIENILNRQKIPIICGGTGLYIDALVESMSFPSVPPDEALREKLSHRSTEELAEYLREQDEKVLKKIDTKNKVRLVRAIEIIDTLGYYPERKRSQNNYQTLFIGLKLPQEELYKNIDLRINRRIQNGSLIKEVQDLHQSGLSYERLYELGLEYRFVSLYLKGELGKEAMQEQLSQATKKFAKRQATWFKRNKKIHWFHPADDKELIFNLVKKFLTK